MATARWFVSLVDASAGTWSLSRASARARYNVQYVRAVGFYHRHGLVTVGRSDTDADGRPFPLLHLAARHAS